MGRVDRRVGRLCGATGSVGEGVQGSWEDAWTNWEDHGGCMGQLGGWVG